MKKLGLLLGMFAMLISNVYASGPVDVRSFNVNQLNAYEGKYVTAFYLSARAAGFSYGDSALRVNKVLEKSSPIQIVDGKVTIPRKKVIQSGYNILNYVKFVIHSSNSSIILKNVDGSTPTGVGQNESGSSRYIKSFYLATSKLAPINSPAPAVLNP